MDIFEYVAVLVSIIIGLGMAHLLRGLVRIIQHPGRHPAYWVHLGWVGYLARLVRASMLEILGENHIRTARAFGLPERTIVLHYALRLAILPTVALLGVGIGYMLSGAVFAEIVFARPGVGKLIFDAVITRNYPLVMGSVIMTTIIFVICTTVADLVSAFLDPRIRENL